MYHTCITHASHMHHTHRPRPTDQQLLELEGEDTEVFGLAAHPSRDLLALGLVDGRALLYGYEGMGETCTLKAELRCVSSGVATLTD